MSTTGSLLSTELLVGRGWIWNEVISDFCIEVVCTMRELVLIRNFFEGVLGLVSRYSRTLLFYNSELLRRKRIDRARVDNKVDSQMFMLPVIEAEALNIVC